MRAYVFSIELHLASHSAVDDAAHGAPRPNVGAHLPARPAAVLQRPLPLLAPAGRVARGSDASLMDLRTATTRMVQSAAGSSNLLN